jgi:predicted dehydrogenase
MSNIRWGILGPGSISKTFAKGLADVPGADLAAVGSRDLGRAKAFAAEFGFRRAHGAYQDLVNDPEVDVIYIGTPHSFHHPHTLLALNAGKHVLCEKPFALSAAEATEMVAKARETGLFLMEAMWTRFLPALQKVRELVADGTIGELRMIQADFGFRTEFNPAGRLFDPALGGGSLLDVGVYPISLASMLLGPAERVRAIATLGETGVDEQAAVLLGYASGAMAMAFAAVRTNSPEEAVIVGTEGWIKIEPPFWHATQLTVQKPGQPLMRLELPYEGNGYNYQAAAVQAAIVAGQTESTVMSLDESIQIMATLDEILAAL